MDANLWPHTAECPTCGALWPPTALENDRFPGSACDMGECICGACEGGDDCYKHDAKPPPPTVERD